MKFQVIEEKENPVIKRREIIISLDYEGKSTPSRAELQKILAERFKANIESVEISKVLSEVGLTKGKAWVKIWQDKKIPIYAEMKKEKAEKPVEKKEKPKEAPKVEAAKTPEKIEEKPKPEKK